MLNYQGFSLAWVTLLSITKVTKADLFSIYNDKDTNQINSHNVKQIKSSFPHDSFELAFPFFNELFPLSGLEAKSKELLNKNNLQKDKDLFFSNSDMAKEDAQLTDDKIKKKKGKDKFIMSFTELFIPFQNRKPQFEANNIKRNDIFDDIFNSFPFVDMDGGGFFEKHDKQSNRKRRLPKKKFEKNIHQMNGSKSLFDNDEINITPKQSLLTRFESKFFKLPNEIKLFSKDNKTNEVCCNDHNECHKVGHCNSNQCNANALENGSIESEINKKSILMDKTFLICVIPALIGFSALIFGIEVLRRHNELVKQTPFLSQYKQVQTC